MPRSAVQMRFEQARAEVRCGGFRLDFDEGGPQLRLLPGERHMPGGMADAVLQGLSDAPALLSAALRVSPPPRPYDRVEVSLHAGEVTQGEAEPLGIGCIRLRLGERTPLEDASAIARHEALHLLLAAALRGGALWTDPELAFADWIVRGIESGLDPRLPRFRAPLPGLLDPVPASRLEVRRQLSAVSAAPAAARRYFGEPLFAELQRLEAEGGDGAAVERRQLWVVEAALGTHYLEAAARVHPEQSDALRVVVLDDWLADYEQYARSLANAPAGAGNLWRLSDPGWSADPLVRLSVAAQALQAQDACWFAGDRYDRADEPVIWKNRGRIRVPLVAPGDRARPAPIHAFRAVVRAMPEAARLVEQAAGDGAERFEARALWPRIVARLFAGGAAADAEPGQPAQVQIVEGPGADAAFAEWRAAADALRSILGPSAAWVPRVAEPRAIAMLADLPRPQQPMLLVHAAPVSQRSLAAARWLAARAPVRGAVFAAPVEAGPVEEQLADADPPLDPRYREQGWVGGSTLPVHLADLPSLADEATRDGRLTTPVSHLLSMIAVCVEECPYPRVQR